VLKICSICGNNEFQKCSYVYDKLRKDLKLECTKCKSLDRHRSIKYVYDKYINKEAKNILLFSIDPAKHYLPDFTEISIFNECNSINLKDIDRPDETYDLIYCHHILEHIDNDALAFSELCRILKYNGQLCWSIPMVSSKDDINLDPTKDPDGHYRLYGENIFERIKKWDNFSDVSTKYFIENDPITNSRWGTFITTK